MLTIIRFILWGAIVVTVVVMGVLWMGWLTPGPQSPNRTISTVEFGGLFALTNHKGEPFTHENLRGRPYAVFFGFTHCPDVCPTALWELSELMKKLGSDADTLAVIFVTVDPERDTPEALANYLTSFDPRIVGLTGTPQEIDAMTKLFRAYYKKVPTNDGSYTMDHTATVYLMDRQGRLSGALDRQEKNTIQLEKLRRLIARGDSD